MPAKTVKTRYNLVAIILHWVMAIAFLLMLGSGLAMVNLDALPQSLKFNMYQWHKSLGVLLLLTFFVRIGWRLFHKPPKLPASFKKLDVIGAKLGHWGLYALMIAMPITGWVMVSSSVYGLPTIVFGWFEWPHIEILSGNETINALSKDAHEILGWVFIAMIAVHIGAVLKHYIFDKENLLTRMIPGKDE
jgi:cytochrome b561